MTIIKSNTTCLLPVLHNDLRSEDREVIAIFLQRYRDILFMREDQKILSCIEKAAEITSHSPQKISAILLNNGLRATRRSFPQTFLDEIDMIAYHQRGRVGDFDQSAYDDIIDYWHNVSDAPVKGMVHTAYYADISKEKAV